MDSVRGFLLKCMDYILKYANTRTYLFQQLIIQSCVF